MSVGAQRLCGSMAATTVLTVPIILLFFLARRTFIQGVTLTGLKG